MNVNGRLQSGPCDTSPAPLPAGCSDSPLGQDPIRNQQTFTTATEQSLGTTSCPSTCVTIVINGQSDAGAQGASIKVYSTLHGIRTLEKTFTMPNPIDSLSHDFTWAGTACDFFEVTFTPVAAMAVPLIWCIQGFGEENAVSTAGGAVTLAGDVTGASNANTVVKLTGSGGLVTTAPGLTIKPASSGFLVIGDLVNTSNLTLQSAGVFAIGNNSASVNLTSAGWVPGSDNAVTLGTNALRWSLVRGVVITSGDLDLEDEKRDAHWTLREMPGWLLAMNRKTGERFKVPLVTLSEEEEVEAEESERTSERNAHPEDFGLSRAGLDS